MGIQTYNNADARLGKMAGEIIGHAMASECLNIAVKNMDMPKNKSDNLIVRSWVPYGATAADPNNFFASQSPGTGGNAADMFAMAHLTSEGITPAADTIVPRDVTIPLNQYSALYSLTDKDYDLFEDDIAEAMKEQTGERMGLVRELVLYGKMKAATSKTYAGSAGATVASRSLVTGAVHAKLLSGVVRNMNANHGKMITRILSPSTNVGTVPVEAGFIAFCHTDLEYDLRQLTDFHPVAEYGSRQTISDYELGTWQNIRFVLSPELQPYIDAGVAVGSTGLKANSTNVDVYPIIIVAKEAFACLKLRGQSVIDPIFIPPGQKDKNDPLGQRGYIGAKFYMGAEILNPSWLQVLEVGVTDL
jgi:N4-gp56 family major capsid protein